MGAWLLAAILIESIAAMERSYGRIFLALPRRERDS